MEQSSGMSCDAIDEQCNRANFSSETDPLGEFGAEGALASKPKFYRMNSKIFAEPLENTTNEENSSKDYENETEIKFIDNVVICKDPGKQYKKYVFNIEDGSPTSCPQRNCHRKFATKKKLIAHIRRFHCVDRKRYLCERCGRGFPELNMLRKHADTHCSHTKQCPVCGVKLRLRTSLQVHLRSHSNERPHQCEVCKMTFMRASNKAAHVKFVHREGTLECEECEKRFSSRKQWSLHRATHREKKPD